MPRIAMTPRVRLALWALRLYLLVLLALIGLKFVKSFSEPKSVPGPAAAPASAATNQPPVR
jgi:hypothetical protein